MAKISQGIEFVTITLDNRSVRHFIDLFPSFLYLFPQSQALKAGLGYYPKYQKGVELHG